VGSLIAPPAGYIRAVARWIGSSDWSPRPGSLIAPFTMSSSIAMEEQAKSTSRAWGSSTGIARTPRVTSIRNSAELTHSASI
jgi:hypothetical protein